MNGAELVPLFCCGYGLLCFAFGLAVPRIHRTIKNYQRFVAAEKSKASIGGFADRK